MSKKKKTDIYLRVIAGAFVTIPEKGMDPQVGRVLVKVRTDGGGEDLFGFLFADLQAVDSCIAALERVREVIGSKPIVHQKLKTPIGGEAH